MREKTKERKKIEISAAYIPMRKIEVAHLVWSEKRNNGMLRRHGVIVVLLLLLLYFGVHFQLTLDFLKEG